MWREFATFELTVLVLCWLSVVILTEGPTTVSALHDLIEELQTALGKVPLSRDALQQSRVLGDATPEELLSLYWMRRTTMLPYRSWYLHGTHAYSSVPPAQRLPPPVIAEGQVVYPVHALYLYVCGAWLRLTRPELANSVMSTRAQPLLTHAEAVELRQAFAWVSVACVLVVGVPGLWCLISSIAHLLRRAVSERERAARLQLPADVCESVSASAMGPTLAAGTAAAASAGAITPEAPEGRDVGPSGAARELLNFLRRETTEVATFLGALIVVILSVLPPLAMELSTLQPWCLCGSLLVWCVHLVLQNELQLHPGASLATDAAFDLTTPLVVEGAVEFFGLKRKPSLRPLVALSMLLAVMALTMTPCLYVVPVLLVWTLSACWQHGYLRVLVRVKVPQGARDPSADRDGYSRVGYSCYRDRLHMYSCFGNSTVLGVLLVLAVTTPFWLYQQPAMAFMDLFACPSKTSPASVKAGVNLSSLSFTGGRELHARCLSGAYNYYTCTLPTPNMWQLTEWFGMPWTDLAKSFTRVFTLDRNYVDSESPLWLDYGMVVLLVLANTTSILVLTFYRVRKPPLSFETPVEYATERAAQRAELETYYLQKRAAARGAPAAPKSNKAHKSAAAAGDAAERKRAKIVTCVSREEYIVKQVVLVAWMLSIAALSCTLFVLQTRPSSSAMVFPCSSLLAAVYAVVHVLRREQPLAFHPMPDAEPRQAASAGRAAAGGEGGADAAAAAQQSAPVAADGAATSMLAQRDRDDPRPPAASRWCTTPAAPSMAHVADVSWLYATFAAAELGTGALTWLTMPVLLHQGIIAALGGGVAVSLALLRRWARTDTTSRSFLVLGGISCVLMVLLLIGQAVPQSDGFAAPGQPASVTDTVGDVYSHGSENTLRMLIYQCAVAAVMYGCCLVHAALRVAGLALEPEEMRIVPVDEELSYLNKAKPAAGAAAAGAQKKHQ